MDIRMPNGCILSTNNEEVAKSYINKMGGVEVTNKKFKKPATKVSSALDAE